MTEEDIEVLNPQMTWSRRKVKSVIKRRAKSLIPNVSYAWGCRGHPGLVIERRYWPGWSVGDLYGADVAIRSLVDGVEESCSIYHCAPVAIPKKEAEEWAEKIRTTNSFDISVESGKYPIETLRKWLNDWIAEGTIYYVLHDQNGHTVCSQQVYNAEDAQKKIDGLKQDWVVEKGEITNPRMVDMRTYPAPIRLL